MAAPALTDGGRARRWTVCAGHSTALPSDLKRKNQKKS